MDFQVKLSYEGNQYPMTINVSAGSEEEAAKLASESYRQELMNDDAVWQYIWMREINVESVEEA